jgi:DNA-binding Lrp family transcriptional regulator
MGDTNSPRPPPAAQPPWWRIGRASLGFILDNFAIGRGTGDILDPMILAVILEANVAPINQDAELSRRYATLDAPPPDALRRPVSVNAVAASLRLPYETVRRRIAKLAATGACVAGPRGVIVPASAVQTPAYVAAATYRYERLKAFYRELMALGALEAGALQAPDAPTYAAPPIRAANRAVSEYLLRVIEAIMRRLGDPLTGLVLLEMARANAEHLPAAASEIEAPMPDEARRPVSALELSRRLGLPPETVRRHVRRLEAEDFCRRTRGGRLAALEQLGRGPGGVHGLADNLQNVQRLFARCAALGIVGYWEAQG